MKREDAFRLSMKIISSLSTAGMYLAGTGILIMAVLITLEIAARHLFGFSLLVVDEWSGYLLVIVTFLGLAYTMKTRGFLQIEFLLNRLTPIQSRLLNLVLTLLALTYAIVIDYKLVAYTWSSYSTGLVSVSISQTPLFVPQLFMPLGVSLLVLELLREAVRSVSDLISPDADHSAKKE